MSERVQGLANWLRERLQESGARGFVFGLSGGIDSAVVAGLCRLAAPQRVLGVLLPCYSHPQDEVDARLAATALNIPVARVPLDAAFDALVAALRSGVKGLPAEVESVDIKQQVPEANIKPRLRMTSLYFIANSLDYLVAGTGNRSELTLGYFTKYGDGGVDILPIGGLLKSEVREVARELGIPEPIITKPPTAGLWMGQTDEDEMGFSYEMLERYLADGPSAVPAQIAARIEQLRRSSEHKRRLVPVPGTTGG
jgi:NAD+ synthase